MFHRCNGCKANVSMKRVEKLSETRCLWDLANRVRGLRTTVFHSGGRRPDIVEAETNVEIRRPNNTLGEFTQ